LRHYRGVDVVTKVDAVVAGTALWLKWGVGTTSPKRLDLDQDGHDRDLRQIKPKIIVPMLIFAQATLDKFLTRIGDFYAVRHVEARTVILTRSELPAEPEIMVLPGR
jgi:hypothetical protein